MWRNSKLRRNWIAIVTINLSANFCSYMISYYTKYFPGSFFVNYAFVGVADFCFGPYSILLQKVFGSSKKLANFMLLNGIMWCLIVIVF